VVAASLDTSVAVTVALLSDEGIVDSIERRV
jgi:hypothetical protein